MKLKNENKLILKQWVRVFFLIVIVAMIALSIFLIVKSMTKDTTREELYTYNYNSNLDYKVYLKDNAFFNTPYLGMNKQYIASLIDYVQVDTSFDLQSSADLDYTYTYQIIAQVNGAYQSAEGKAVNIWSKDYTVSPAETQSASGNKITINKSVNLDYDEYNQIMTEFRDAFGLSIDASVDLVLKVDVTGKMKGEDTESLHESNEFTLDIPLLEPTVQIKPDYVNNGREIVYASEDASNTINIPLLVVGVALLLLSLVILKSLWSSLIRITKKSEYVIELNKILKEYADIIAESTNLPDLSQYDVVNIKHFRDLVDIEEELRVPILYTEVREDYESWFIIISEKTAYKFILKQSDLIVFQK